MDRRWITLILIAGIVMMCSVVYADEEKHSLAGYHIVLDAGHGGYDPGAIGISGTQEKNLNLAIVRYLRAYLEQRGAQVTLTRYADTDLAGTVTDHRKQEDMKNRMQIINGSDAQFMISIHQNSYTDSRYWGPQVFYKQGDSAAEELALLIQNQLNTYAAQGCTRVVQEGSHYYILKNAKVPAVLVECGFITNSKEEELLSDPVYQRKIALGIYLAITQMIENKAIDGSLDFGV